MSVRCIFLGKYTAESIKGIMGGSDRMAAVKAVVAAAGGSINNMSFTRGPFDVIVDVEMPSAEMMLGSMATIQASGSMEDLMYLECVEGDPIWDAARTIAAAYKPANAQFTGWAISPATPTFLTAAVAAISTFADQFIA